MIFCVEQRIDWGNLILFKWEFLLVKVSEKVVAGYENLSKTSSKTVSFKKMILPCSKFKCLKQHFVQLSLLKWEMFLKMFDTIESCCRLLTQSCLLPSFFKVIYIKLPGFEDKDSGNLSFPSNITYWGALFFWEMSKTMSWKCVCKCLK